MVASPITIIWKNWYGSKFALRLAAQRYRIVLGPERTAMVDNWGVNIGNAWEVNRDGTCNLRKGEWGIKLRDANGWVLGAAHSQFRAIAHVELKAVKKA